jgi:hypothetical protein
MPAIVPRWALIPKSVYAVGPAFDALPDMKELNAIKALELANLDIAVSGMWIAEDDGVLMPRTIQFGRAQGHRRELGRLHEGAGDRRRLQRHLHEGRPAAPRDPPRVHGRSARAAGRPGQDRDRDPRARRAHPPAARPALRPPSIRVAAPVPRPLLRNRHARQPHHVGHGQRRAFSTRRPSRSNGREFSIKFISPIARAQSLEEVSAMDRHEAALGAQAAVKPEVLDTYDFDGAARMRAKLLGVPAKLVLSQDDVDAKRQARADAQDEAANAETQRSVIEQAAPKVIEKAA